MYLCAYLKHIATSVYCAIKSTPRLQQMIGSGCRLPPLIRTITLVPLRAGQHLRKKSSKPGLLSTHSSKFDYSSLSPPYVGTGRHMATSRQSPSAIVRQDYDYFLVLDFEATCVESGRIKPQEIIEFPVLKVSGVTFQTESTFHQYVEPQVHGVGDFCTKLTGITPEMVKDQPTLEQTLKLFHDWMNTEGLLNPRVKSIFVTCGDWDLKTMLPSQCEHFRIPHGSYFHKWINIKKAFAAVMGHFPKGMMPMLEGLNIQHIGRHHSGIDDCRNIANILRALAERKFKFKETAQRS